jgi:hypothetical protein
MQIGGQVQINRSMNPTWFKHPFDILIILVMTKAPASFFAIQ